jgi:predicted enzyme related to lactoylglutathione lyase
MSNNGKFVWFEYVTTDTQKAKGFFGELFGWTTQEVPIPELGTYAMIASGDRTIGGFLPTPEGAPKQAHWLSHLQVASAKDAAEKVTKLGGKVQKSVTKVGDFGTMAIVSDPHGGVLSLWQPAKTEPTPAPTTNTFCWNELASSDPAASVAFYRALGELTAKAMDMGEMGTYHVLEVDGQPAAGIMGKSMPQQPHAWLPYVQVASADKTVEKAKKLGATVIVPPADIPNVGRFAIFTDTQGAPLGVLQPPAGR